MHLVETLFQSSERGLTLILALVIVAGVSLTVVPLVLLTSTNLQATKRAELRFEELHSAESGVEHALWRIRWDGSFDPATPAPPYTMVFNGLSTEVKIDPAPVSEPVYPDPVPNLDAPLTPLETGGRIKIWDSAWWDVDTVSPCYQEPCPTQDFYFTILIENYGATRVHMEQFGSCMPEGFTYQQVVDVQNLWRPDFLNPDPLAPPVLLTTDDLNEPGDLISFSVVEGDQAPLCPPNRSQIKWDFASPLPYVESPASLPPGIGMITYRATATKLPLGRYCNEAWAEPNPAVFGGVIPSGGCDLFLTWPQWNISSSAGGVTVTARAAIFEDQEDAPIVVLSWQTDHSPLPEADLDGMHVGDLEDALVKAATGWDATIVVTVHDADHAPVEDVIVQGIFEVGDYFTSGTKTCLTDSSGQCVITYKSLPEKDEGVFRVTGLSGDLEYDPMQNHDPSPDSNGTVIWLDK